MLSEYKKEKGKIEKFADKWCKDNNYPITKYKYKTKNMSRPYKGSWVKNKKDAYYPRAIDGYGE